MSAWSIGSAETERLTVTPLSRPTKDRGFSFAAVECRVAIKAGGFSGEFIASLPFDEAVNFRDQLSLLVTKLNGTAEFTPILEAQLEILVTMDRLGHFCATGEAADKVDSPNRLSFQLQGDQSELTKTVHQLNEFISFCRGEGKS